MSSAVPTILHQTWRTLELPGHYRRWRATVLAHHRGWEHRLWTDEDNRRLVREHYPWFLETYDGYRHHIERVDAARYFILLRHGGVYLDLDMECLRPLDPLVASGGLHLSLLAGPSVRDTVVANAFMAAPPGHPFFAYLTRRLPYLLGRDVTFADVMNNTGPDMLTRQVRLLEQVFDIDVIGLDKICDRAVLPEHPTLAGKSLEEIRAGKLLYLIHHHTNAWNRQHPPPGAPVEGFSLFLGHDIPGFDLEYVEYAAGEYQVIAEAARRRPDAAAFNYNGFVKGRGGRLEPGPTGTAWMKPGMVPWVCVKNEALADFPALPAPGDRAWSARPG